MTIEKDRAAKIAVLNDEYRHECQRLGCSDGRIVLTHGVTTLGADAVLDILGLVARFNDFNEDNDPHGEHDFGCVEYQGNKLYWKFDYYDLRMKFGSADPSDPKQTTRVLTIMLAEEY